MSNQQTPGVFSTGENIIKNISDSAKVISKKLDDPMLINYTLQARLSNFYKNNPGQVLKFSEQYSGLKDENNNSVPLGGKIDVNRTNYGNRQDSKAFSKEFDFWKVSELNCKTEKPKTEKPQTEKPQTEKPKTEKKVNVDNFINNNIKENFGNKIKVKSESSPNGLYISCGCLILIILIIIGMFLYFND